MGSSGSEPPESGDGDDPGTSDDRDATTGQDGLTTEELREQVERKYDFDDFGPQDMAEMSAEEWDAAFDADSWITGTELLDRVEADLKQRVLDRDVFARIERGEDYLLAYSDAGFAVVYPDGSVQGEGTVLRDVKPTIALCSMDDYDVPDVPDGEILPDPQDIPDGGSELGNWMLQLVAFFQVFAGLGLLAAGLFFGAGIIAVVAGVFFLVIAIGLFFTVANARLSDRFRAEEFRDRLRAMNVDSGERPDFLPVDEEGQVVDEQLNEEASILPPRETADEE
jgi:hypothetical protein